MHSPQVFGVALGALIAAVGLIGMAVPSVVLDVGRSLQTPGALYLVAAIRIALGTLLFWAASSSRLPRVLRVIGAVVVVAGLITPLLGVERVQAVLTWWEHQGQLFTRGAPAVAVVFGGLLIYAFAPAHRLSPDRRT